MQIFDGGKLWRIFHQKILASKTLVNCCLLYLFMSQDIIKICMVKFGEPPVIRQIYQGFICQKLYLLYLAVCLKVLLAFLAVWMESWKCTHACSINGLINDDSAFNLAALMRCHHLCVSDIQTVLSDPSWNTGLTYDNG